MEDTLARRSAPTAMWPDARSALVVALNYGPDHDPLETLSQRETGNISVYARGRDYHDVIKSRLKQLAGEVAQLTGARGEGLRRHRAPDGKAARPEGRPRLAGQAHQSRQPRSRLLVLPRLGAHRRRPGARTRPSRPLRLLPRLSRHLPDERLSRALPARCPPLHLLPHHRARRPHPAASSAPPWATASMAATTASPSAPGTSSPQRRLRGRPLRPRRTEVGPASTNSPRWTTPRSAKSSPAPPSSARAATASCAMSPSPSAIRGSPPDGQRSNRGWPIPRRWCAARRSGRRKGSAPLDAAAFAALRAARVDEHDPAVLEEWGD
jgi:hypothetical protein